MTKEEIRLSEEKNIEDVLALLVVLGHGYDNNIKDELDKYDKFYWKMAAMKSMIDLKPKLYFRKQKEAFSNMKKQYKEDLDKRVDLIEGGLKDIV